MRKIKQVSEIDRAKLTKVGTYASREIVTDPTHLQQLEQKSLCIWELYVKDEFIAYAGVAQQTFLGPIVFWLLWGSNNSLSVLRALKIFSAELHQKFPHVITFVEEAWKEGEKFAQFCGFRKSVEGYAVNDKLFVKHVRDI